MSRDELERIIKKMYAQPKPRCFVVSPSFYWAWRRRWQAHYLSVALGLPGKRPPI